MDGALVAGRECGGCTVCCTVLTIDEPELRKLPGHTCPNCAIGAGCRIHATRPEICRVWFCGWRRLKWTDEALRPDLSGVLIRLTREDIPAHHAGDIGVEFALLTRAALRADGLPEAIAAAIAANIATFLIVPGAAGFTSTRLPLNAALADQVARRDKPALLVGLRRLAARGRRAVHRPVVLKDGH